MNILLLWFHKLGSPPTFYRLAGLLLPWCYGIGLVLGLFALYSGLVLAPRDYQQGDAYRIIFVHVPAAWMSLFAYVFMAANAFIALVWHIKLSEILAMASAPIGAAFTFIALVTGAPAAPITGATVIAPGTGPRPCRHQRPAARARRA